ncbi:hypothetical protein [Vulcanisaeta sp. JCM 16159]|uniref:hypothetical protein n=1 Tax=Vulcanisaeta sp. JCM 16159 TaxID=1295371 RepID=UPI0006D04976|nr:hypothetical protein [Vulcanisaeta sp. JCM 16159]
MRSFIISLFFLLIVFKVDEEFIKHWRALRVYALKLMCEECKKLPDLNKYVNVFEIAALFPLKRRRLSVHRLTESLIVFIASFTIIYAVTYVVSPSNAELVFIASIGGAIAIAILYYLLLERLLPCGPEHPVGVWVSRGCKVYVEPGVHGIDIPIDDEDLRAFKETAKRLCDEMAKTCKEVETN